MRQYRSLLSIPNLAAQQRQHSAVCAFVCFLLEDGFHAMTVHCEESKGQHRFQELAKFLLEPLKPPATWMKFLFTLLPLSLDFFTCYSQSERQKLS